jgi:serine/threonine-protein kinase
MDSQQILQRFHQERQILASLGHPHIARLLDGGSTSTGQPYFVMEYVDGQPLDVHCAAARLPLARRLELFGQICQAVHFAHQNLVVHRDLKPSNILVDADGRPKLVDFGIAKLLDPERIGVRVERTATVARLMTPHYASPEQVQGKPVSTASDVYSLGVVLYQLLTGRRPYELGSHALHEIERVVCAATPTPPSQLLRARGERLPRDLDNIVLMAMRKEPERRYASAQELADDVRRCLEHRPVLARRDTVGYRVCSFVRRNTGAVAAAAVVFLSLLGGGVATTWQWREAVAERTRAQTQRMTAEETLAFVVDLFKVSDLPVKTSEITALQVLQRGAVELKSDARPPEVRAALDHTLGVVYKNLGDYPHAAALLSDAVTARRQFTGGERDLADSLYQRGAIDSDNGQATLADALLRDAMRIRIRLFGPDDLSVADVLERLAANVGYNITVQEAEDDYRRALEIRRAHFRDGDPRLLASIAGLASLYRHGGHFDKAEALFHEGLAIRDHVPRGRLCQPGESALLYELGLLRYVEGRYADSDRFVAEGVDCLQREVGPDHVDVVDMRSSAIWVECELGRYAEAEARGRESLIVRTELHGDRSPAVDNALHHLAHVLYERDKLAEAEVMARDALERRQNAYGTSHTSVTGTLIVLGDIHLARGDAPGAAGLYRKALASWPSVMGDDHPDVVAARRGLAEALLGQGDLVDARREAERALAQQHARLGPDHPAVASTLLVLGAIAEASSPAQAEPLLRQALDIWQRALGPDHPYTARAESLLGECLALQHRTAEALPLLHRALDRLRAALGPDHRDARRAQQRLWAVEPPTRRA